MIQVQSENEEVLYPADDIVFVDSVDIEEMKKLALLNKRKRIRLCAHHSPTDLLHEMLIIHEKSCYVRPHKHLGKDESITVLEGEADVVLFNDDGSIQGVQSMGEINSGKKFFCRILDSVYHMLIIRSELLLFHECTQGPFNRDKTIFPDWAPVEGSSDQAFFINYIKSKISVWSDE